MTRSNQSTFWLAISAATALLACGDDGGDPVPQGDPDAGTQQTDSGKQAVDSGQQQDSGNTQVDTGSPEPDKPMLADGVVGTACSADADCQMMGRCLTEVDLAGTVAAFTSVGAAATPAPGGMCSADCDDDAQCGADGVCIGETAREPGLCRALCDTDGDCREGYRCRGEAGSPDEDAGVDPEELDPATCVPVPETASLGANVAGAECGADSDCATGGTCQLQSEGTRFVPGSTFPGGSCSGVCLEDADCGAGGRCLTESQDLGAGACLFECASDGDCREGYRCRDLGAFSACLPGDPVVAAGEIGIACTPDDQGNSPECGSRCLDDLANALLRANSRSVPAPGGYCSANCVSDADCGEGLCLGALALDGLASSPGICYKSCASAADCGRDGYECSPFRSRLSDSMPDVCQPVPEEEP